MAEITQVTVEFEDGSRVSLDDMRRDCRRERVEDLLDDLIVLCEDVADARRPEDRRLSVVRRSQ